MRGKPRGSVPLADLISFNDAAERYLVAKEELKQLAPGAFQAFRAATGMSQASLGKVLDGRSQAYVWQVENRKRTPSTDSLSAFLNSTVVQEVVASGEDSSGHTDGCTEEEQSEEVPSQ